MIECFLTGVEIKIEEAYVLDLCETRVAIRERMGRNPRKSAGAIRVAPQI